MGIYICACPFQSTTEKVNTQFGCDENRDERNEARENGKEIAKATVGDNVASPTWVGGWWIGPTQNLALYKY